MAAFAAAMVTATGIEAGAQSPPLRDLPSPRVAVVLGGGTAKALAHIGVLDELERLHVPIDLVTGTSMGAIIGGLYAAGYTPRGLEDLINAADWSAFFKPSANRRLERLHDRLQDDRFTITFPLDRGRPTLPAGAVSRQSIATHLDRYLWPVHDDTNFAQLPTRFGALVTDLANGDAVLLQNGSLAAAMEGSAALPGVFAPLLLPDGRLVVDGAVNRNLAAEDARRLGADVVICVDVSERIEPVSNLRSLVDVLDQTVSFRVQLSNAVQRPFCSVIIEPDITGISSTDFTQVAKWIDRGRVAALAHRAQLEAIADSARRTRGVAPPRAPLRSPDSVWVSTVRWSHVSIGADAIAEGAIALRGGSWVTQRKAEMNAARLFATGRFDEVSYRIVPHDSTHDLVFDLTEGDRDQLGIGVRYDTPHGVALLATASVADWLSPGSTSSVSARLGETKQFDARDVRGEGLNAPFLRTYRVTSTTTVLREVAAPAMTLPIVFNVQEASAQIEHTFPADVVGGIEVSHMWSHDGAVDSAGPFRHASQSLSLGAATISFDSRDQILAPAQGIALFWRSEVDVSSRYGSRKFARHVIDADGAIPVVRWLSLIGSGTYGRVTGANLPLHDWFYLGGSVQSAVWQTQFVPFPGINPQSLAGRSVRVVGGGAQVTAPAGLSIAIREAVGNVYDRADTARSPGVLRGVGMTITRRFAPGPVSLSVGARSWRQQPVVELAFGARF